MNTFTFRLHEPRLLAAAAASVAAACATAVLLQVEQWGWEFRFTRAWSDWEYVAWRTSVGMAGAGAGFIMGVLWAPRRAFWKAAGITALAAALIGTPFFFRDRDHTGAGFLWHAVSLLNLALPAGLAAGILSEAERGEA